MTSAKEVIAKTAGDYYDGYADPADTPENWSRGLGCANDILAALDAAGYVVVPREPTEAMIDAVVHDADLDIYWSYNADGRPGEPRDAYRAMIAAQESKP